MSLMLDKLDEIEAEYQHLSERMCDPETASNPSKYRELASKASELEDIVSCYGEYKRVRRELDETRQLLHEEKDAEVIELAEEERDTLAKTLEEAEHRLKELLVPQDPNDKKNVVMEIRAGTGGEEAALFAGDLFRMYQRYAESRGWGIDITNSSITGLGGFKEIVFLVEGNGAYSQLKFESGAHRVQRVPATEASGRIHTSAVTVAVLPEAEEVDLRIDPKDVRFDVYRSSGPGGQSVNTTDSAVRLTHIPTGIVVTCQDEKSQHKNRAKAFRVLRSRILDARREEQAKEISEKRRNQVGSGDRSERIRTYNFPQNRVTDHRIGLTLRRLDSILDGDIQELIDNLVAASREAGVKTSA